MLSPAESNIVLETLTKRRAWLRKTLDDGNLDPAMRQEHMESIKLIEQAMKKIASNVSGIKPTANTVLPKLDGSPIHRLTMASTRVLIAEDNADSANLLTDVLQDFGIKHIELAVDGMQAFDKIKTCKEPYHLILCDWDMPELNGLEVHSKAKASNTLRGAHFMMVTAVSEASRIREAIQQGITDYIVKPIDMDVLETKIKTALNIEDSK